MPLRAQILLEIGLVPGLEVLDARQREELPRVALRNRLRELTEGLRARLPGPARGAAWAMLALGPGGRVVDRQENLQALGMSRLDRSVEGAEVVRRVRRVVRG